MKDNGRRMDDVWLWIRSALEEIEYLLKCIFSYFCSGVKVNRGVEFRHSTRNASRIRLKMRNGVSQQPLLTLLCAGYSVKLIYFRFGSVKVE